MTYYCPDCDVRWWAYMYREFDACPQCGGGTRWVQEPGSPEAMELYAEALARRAERDKRKAREVAFDEYYAAWCHAQAIEFEVAVRQDLSRLPVAEPRRDRAA